MHQKDKLYQPVCVCVNIHHYLLTIFAGQHLHGDLDAAASGVDEGRPVPHRAARLADVVRAGEVAMTTQVVDGAEEAWLAGVGVTRVRHQGNLVCRLPARLWVCMCVYIYVTCNNIAHTYTHIYTHVH